MSSVAPGWHKDPADPATQRWWDGEGWVGKAIPADATPPDGPPPADDPPPAAVPVPAGSVNLAPPASDPPPAWGAPPPGWGAPPPPPQGWSPPPGWGAPPPPPQQQGWSPPPGWVPPPGHPGYPGYPVGYGYPMPELRPHGLALAGLGQRLLARLLDIAVVLVLNVVVNGWFAYQWALEFAPLYRAAVADPFGDPPQASGRMSELMWTMLIIATLVWLAYEAPAVASRGQTLGKRIMRIKVVGVESTAPLGFPRAFRRWARLGLWTPLWSCGLGFLVQLLDSLSPVFDQRLRQAWHDKTAGTVVVAVPPGGIPDVPKTPSGGGE